ncbi:hypothetical protein FOB72_17500 (plasmid) [Cupriavidus pauculus]|uniref:Uncharacterized protein n=1 Tax=Cupriavidus pauculus TaxID=82633 RepID=A0A5P2H8A6_9BURK|nr:hypothetical protein FOB72_17500 [Cupriavidus pauculus]
MKNPWIKKNPFMSMWLSQANRVSSSARGRITAEAKRQSVTAATEAATQVTKFWTAVLAPKTLKPKRRTKT